MENIEDFRRSWKHSSEESRRLVDHFQSKPPHSVTSTISLNGTRQLILELTKPLADISQLIRQNIAMCKDREKELANTRLSGDALRKKLQFEQILLRQKELTMPRTVCTEGACINIKDDGTGKQVTEYKSICHSQVRIKPELIMSPFRPACESREHYDVPGSVPEYLPK